MSSLTASHPVVDSPPLLSEVDSLVASALNAALTASYGAVDPGLLGLLHARVAQMVGGEQPHFGRENGDIAERIGALDSWSTSPLFSETERACLALTEQTVVSVTYIDDSMIEGVLDHLDPGELYGLVNALYVVDAAERLAVAWQRLFDGPVTAS